MTSRNVQQLSPGDAISRLLHPRAVALIGASNDDQKFSGQPLRNLLNAKYPGGIYPVNRRGGAIHGVESVTRICDLPGGVDVGLLMVPAASCVSAVRELGEAGVPTAVVAVSGFAEMGTAEGRRLQDELAQAAQESGVRLVGPNCNGLYETREPLPLGYNYTHSQNLEKGSVALISHSGALLGGFLPLLEGFGHGLSAFISCGNEVDLKLTDFMDHFVDDPNTRVIALILDGVSDGPAFRRALGRARTLDKPVVALKLGNTQVGTTAAQAHSSRLAGAQAAYEAVFSAEGVVSVPTLETLAVVSAVLAAGRRPSRPTIIGTSTSGAGGILLADTLGARGLRLAGLSQKTQQAMAPLVGFARVMNPFDIGAAGPTAIESNLEAMATDEGAGALLFYLTPAPTQAWRQGLADGLAKVASRRQKLPVLVISPAPVSAEEADTYRAAGVPVVGSLLDAVTAVKALVDVYAPGAGDLVDSDSPSRHDVGAGKPLSEPASKRFLSDRGIEMPHEVVAGSAAEALVAARSIGFPVVLKAAGAGLTHKSEHQLVALEVADDNAVGEQFTELSKRARALDPDGFEGVIVTRLVGGGVDVLLGVSVDPDFGPMMLLGAGGVLAELIADIAVAPAPLDEPQARALLDSSKISGLLHGHRGSAVCDTDALIDLVVRLSLVAATEANVLEAIDLNPVRVMSADHGLVVLDALVVGSS